MFYIIMCGIIQHECFVLKGSDNVKIAGKPSLDYSRNFVVHLLVVGG